MSVDAFDPPLTIEEAAQALNLRRSSIYKLLKSKQLSTVKILRTTRIRSSDVEPFYASAPVAEYAPLTDKQGARTA